MANYSYCSNLIPAGAGLFTVDVVLDPDRHAHLMGSYQVCVTVDTGSFTQEWSSVAGNPTAFLLEESPEGYRVRMKTGVDRLPEYKEAALAASKVAFETATREGAMVLGILMDCGPGDVTGLNAALSAYEDDEATVLVRDANNVVHSVTYMVFRALVYGVSRHYQGLLQAKWRRDEAIRSASTVEALQEASDAV